MGGKLNYHRDQLRIRDAIAKGRPPVYVGADFGPESRTAPESRGWAEREGGPGSHSVPRRSPAEQATFDAHKRKIQGAPYGPAIVSKSKPISANKLAVMEAKVRAGEASATRKNRQDAAKRERSAANKKGSTGDN